MRKYFFTGLGIILPIVLTVLIVSFLINLLTKPFIGMAQVFLDYYGLLGKSFLFMKTDQLVLITSKLIVLAMLILLTILIGLLARVFFIHYLLRTGDYILHRIPIVNKIYRSIKEVVSTLFESTGQNFSQVVLVPFPHTKGLALGMVVKDRLPPESDKAYEALVSVFVPATPNPTMGFVLLYKREEIHFIDMTVEEALKCIVSCGVMFNKDGGGVVKIHFLEVLDNQSKMRKLCEAVQHHYHRGRAVLITVANDEAARYVDDLLWRHPKESFLPHQIASGKTAAKVVITERQENLNRAEILFNLCPQASPICEHFQTVYEFLDKTHPDKARQSLERQEAYHKMGYSL